MTAECLVWCAISELDVVLRVDISGCDHVYDLGKAIADASMKKIPLLRAEIWRIKDANDWLANSQNKSWLLPTDDEDLQQAADLLLPHKLLTKVLERPIAEHGIEFILRIRDMRDHFSSVFVPPKKRYLWSGISAQKRIFQAEVSRCKNIGELKEVILRDWEVDARDVWKIKSPRDSPAHCSLNDRIRSKTFPKDQDTLFSLADPLSSNTSFDPDTMFDEMTLKESVCFIVTTSSAEIMPPALASTAERRLVWCAVFGRTRLFQININGCKLIRHINPEIRRISGFSERKSQTLVIRDPQMWPISDDSPAPEIPNELERLLEIARPVSLFDSVEAELGKEVDESHLQLVIRLFDDSISRKKHVPKYFAWCSIAGSNATCRLDIEHYVLASAAMSDVLAMGKYDKDYDKIKLWKVKDPQMWRIEDIVTGVKLVPDEDKALEEIADPFTTLFVFEETIPKSLRDDYIHLIAQISYDISADSSSSTESASSAKSISEKNPLVHRQDIQEVLKNLGFCNEIFLDVNRWHVGDIFMPGGERYVLKYLRPGRDDEVDILKYLLSFQESPLNHTPPKVKFPHIEKGALMITPYLGVPVRQYKYLTQDLLSIVQQLLEGVAYLHSKRVAHMDLKTSHVLVDDSARVWIVDYDLSVILEKEKAMVRGFRGTKGCTAPEVGRKAYSPLLADVWAAGKIVRALCGLRPDHKDHDFLESLSGRLMDKSPQKRLGLQEALQQISDYVTGNVMPSETKRGQIIHI